MKRVNMVKASGKWSVTRRTRDAVAAVPTRYNMKECRPLFLLLYEV